jgi:LmbE family N-acetylglucosaminyl deacetylase/glycosyltransferase involved in cell wall biosynthesis
MNRSLPAADDSSGRAIDSPPRRVNDSGEEQSLIPYEATELSGERILVLAAHPDDEALGAGGTLVLNARQAEAVRIWIATDGTAQEGVGPAGESAYAERRRQEAARAAEILGLSSPRFGGLPDRGLAERESEVRELLKREIAQHSPDLVLCPSPVEIHPDHRALAEALWGLIAASRPGDPDHDLFRFLRVAFYEISHPLLPNTLVDIATVAERKEEAIRAYASQQAVRDYAGAVRGLNSYRRITLSGDGPVEGFRVVTWAEVSTRSLEEFRRSIGPTAVRDGERATAPVAMILRTRNRPALLAEALTSLRAQTVRPERVVVVNDGGASVAEVVAPFRDAFEVAVHDLPARVGRSAAANRGVVAAREELIGFLDDDDLCYPDHLERLLRAHRAGPEAVVYSDAVTVLYARQGERWEARQRTLQYSLDFDPDYLLLANYIPIHTLMLPRALYRKVGGFDEGLEYSEDWDFLIRLSLESAFGHVRAVTCEYRVFEQTDPAHAAAGSPEFQASRRKIYERYASRRTEAGLARVMDRMRTQVAFWSERDAVSQGELRFQRQSHRRLHEALQHAESRLAESEGRRHALETERSRVLAENELVHDRLAEVSASSERYERQVTEARAEVDRLTGILNQIYSSRTWKLHLFVDRLRGRG